MQWSWSVTVTIVTGPLNVLTVCLASLSYSASFATHCRPNYVHPPHWRVNQPFHSLFPTLVNTGRDDPLFSLRLTFVLKQVSKHLRDALWINGWISFIFSFVYKQLSYRVSAPPHLHIHPLTSQQCVDEKLLWEASHPLFMEVLRIGQFICSIRKVLNFQPLCRQATL